MNTSSSSDVNTMSKHCDDRFDTLQAMLRQECKNYTTKDFHTFQMKAIKEVQSLYPTQKLDPIDSSCRTKMCVWFQQICTFCKYDVDEASLIIENAMNYLDRYVVTAKGSIALLDRNYYQGMAIICLYMASKIHATAAISASDMSQLSRNVYTAQQIEEMENHILQSLEWHVNPPTISVFVSEFMKLLIAQLQPQQQMDESMVSLLRSVKDAVHAQTKSAMSNEKFIAIPASIIAYTATLNAVQSLIPKHGGFQDVCRTIHELLLIDTDGSCSETDNQIMLVLYHFQQLLLLPTQPTTLSSQVTPVKAIDQHRISSSPKTATAIVSIVI